MCVPIVRLPADRSPRRDHTALRADLEPVLSAVEWVRAGERGAIASVCQLEIEQEGPE